MNFEYQMCIIIIELSTGGSKGRIYIDLVMLK